MVVYGDSELADSNEIAISKVSRLEIICSSALIIITIPSSLHTPHLTATSDNFTMQRYPAAYLRERVNLAEYLEFRYIHTSVTVWQKQSFENFVCTEQLFNRSTFRILIKFHRFIS